MAGVETMKLAEMAAFVLEKMAEKEAAAAVAKQTGQAFEDAKAALVARLSDEGMQNLKLPSGECLALKRSAFFSKVDGFTTDDICEAMKANGLADLVKETFAATTLKAYVQEMHDRAEDPVDNLVDLLPEALREMFRAGEDAPTLSITGRKKRKTT